MCEISVDISEGEGGAGECREEIVGEREWRASTTMGERGRDETGECDTMVTGEPERIAASVGTIGMGSDIRGSGSEIRWVGPADLEGGVL